MSNVLAICENTLLGFKIKNLKVYISYLLLKSFSITSGLFCGVGEDSWESLGLQGDWLEIKPGNPKWCWDRSKGGGKGDNRGWDGWVASLTQWTWVWASSRDGEGQGSLACCNPRGCKELDTTEQLNQQQQALIRKKSWWELTFSASTLEQALLEFVLKACFWNLGEGSGSW